ncbi:MAG: DNA polymerase I [Leptospirales bacterium]|nr:DNA polymerase I [Leptospirales bacterium]
MAYRAYYALQGQNLTHPGTGQPVHAIFGFLRMFVKLLLDYQPEHCAVVWDAPGKTLRDDLYSEYKATRKPMPDDLRPQIDEIKELCQRAGFVNLQQSGYEADDLIGALAHRFGKKRRVLLITGDKDCYQLLNDNVTMLRGAKGVTEFTEITPQWVQQEIGVSVAQIPDYMGLVGDASDNIPGVKGVGAKTAAKLLQAYPTLEEVYEHVTEVESKSLQQKLSEARDLAFLSRDLATIRTSIAQIDELDEAKLATPDITAAERIQLFRQEGYNAIYLELRKAADRRAASANAAAAPTTGAPAAAGARPRKSKKKPDAEGGLFDPPPAAEVAATEDLAGAPAALDSFSDFASAHAAGALRYQLVSDSAQWQRCLTELQTAIEQSGILAIDTETDSADPMRARLVGISLSALPGQAWYINAPPAGTPFASQGLKPEDLWKDLGRLLSAPGLRIVGQNIKYDYIVLKRHGFTIPGISFDTMIASYLLNPNVRRNNMDDLALDQLAYNTIKYEDIAGSGRNKITLDQAPPEKVADYACEDADITLRLHHCLAPQIDSKGLRPVNEQIETPLIPVLASMEMTGVAIDPQYFAQLAKEYHREIAALEKRIFKEAGYQLNLNSTRELQKLLFEDLKLPHGKKTKTGFSTDQSVLEELSGVHPMVDWILDRRKLAKLLGTYIEALPEQIHPQTGRIHTSFNQTIAATGRLSSVDPNLQNIPIREEAGRAIRRGFVPARGNRLLSLDYSQIELRIMAHYSEDPSLIEAFTKKDLDVHARTAASLFDVAERDVTADMRARAKAVNFSIIYGVTEFGLSRNLGVAREEARGYIDRFFEQYPGVRRYMDETVAFAEKHGYVQTLSGRIRQIPEIQSSNRFRREGAARTAINTPIQGASADIIKMAMLQIHEDMRKAGVQSRMILQVHDELLFDVTPDEAEMIRDIALQRMERAAELRTPLRVDWKFGDNWDEAH